MCVCDRNHLFEGARRGFLNVFLLIILLKPIQIKEVAPIVSRSQRQFWKHDVKVARDYNNKSSNPSRNNNLADEFAEFQDNDLRTTTDPLRNLGRPTYQNTWSPPSAMMTLQQNCGGGGRVERAQKMSLAEIETFYMNMSQPLHKNVHTR